MEDDKKKKKNKKKKNKQAAKQTENATPDVRESTSDNQENVSQTKEHDDGRVSVTRQAKNEVVLRTDVDRDEHRANGMGDASYEEQIEELRAEKGAYLEKEASQEEKIKQLENDKDAWMQEEANLKEKLTHLQKEKDALLQEEESLNDKIKVLQKETDSYLRKEAELKMKVLQLETEKDSWLRKEVGFEQKINQLVDETTVLNLKGVKFEEKIKQMEQERDSWLQKEDSIEGRNAVLNNENRKLRAQVMELEELRKGLLQENQQLTENISSLQLQLNKLESNAAFPPSTTSNKHTAEDSDLKSEIEAACALVEKLVTENAELVEKVNELYTELDRRDVRTNFSSSVGSDLMAINAPTAQIADSSGRAYGTMVGAADTQGTSHYGYLTSEASNLMSVSDDSTQSLEGVIIEDENDSNHVNGKDSYVHVKPSEITESDDVVLIQLDKNTVQNTNPDGAQDAEKTDVPITDAPLIGAPFRFISFVTRYVSGADLVENRAGNSGL